MRGLLAMEIVEAKCPVCAKEIPIPSDVSKPYCVYCGVQFLKDAALAFAGASITASISGPATNDSTDFTIVGGTLVDYRGSDAEVVIPNGVSCIGSEAFRGNKALVAITMPDSVTSIGYSAFRECSSLRSVSVSNTLVTLESHVFDACSSLGEVSLPRSVKKIGGWCFNKCSSMTVAKIPSSASLDSDAFKNCPAKIVKI